MDTYIIWDNLKVLEGPWSLTFDCKYTPFLWSDRCPVSTGSIEDATCGASECSHQTPTWAAVPAFRLIICLTVYLVGVPGLPPQVFLKCLLLTDYRTKVPLLRSSVLRARDKEMANLVNTPYLSSNPHGRRELVPASCPLPCVWCGVHTCKYKRVRTHRNVMSLKKKTTTAGHDGKHLSSEHSGGRSRISPSLKPGWSTRIFPGQPEKWWDPASN